MEKKDLSVMSVEEVGNYIAGLPRRELKAFSKDLTVAELHKSILGMIHSFDYEAKKFQEKKNQSAGMRSRKITADLQSFFLEWRKKSIIMSKETLKEPIQEAPKQ